MGHSRPLFLLFLSFRTVQLLKNLAASWIQTRIVGAVGENADHYTTITTQERKGDSVHFFNEISINADGMSIKLNGK